MATALFPANEKKVTRLTRKWIKWLERDKVLHVVDEAQEYLPHHGPRRDTAICEMGYLKRNADRMMYATFKKDGYFIGSGFVEAGCKTVVGKRAKQSGMFWRVYGAQNILNIRCSVMSETYDNYWQARRQAQIQALRPAA